MHRPDIWREFLCFKCQALFVLDTCTIRTALTCCDVRWSMATYTHCTVTIPLRPIHTTWIFWRAWKSKCFQDGHLFNESNFCKKYFSNTNARKLVEVLKDTQAVSMQQARLFHQEKRQFLCMALRELNLVFTDQPGLLGPKVHSMACLV